MGNLFTDNHGHNLIVISGPSGAGKSTIVKELLRRDSEHYATTISCTTREKRPNEENGRDYYFIDRLDFSYRINDDDFIEWDEHFGNYYGTLYSEIDRLIATKNVILEIEVNGGLNVKLKYPNTILIMIVPPDKDELKKRLLSRNTESKDKISERLSRVEYELSKQGDYDYCVLNDDLNRCVSEIQEILRKFENKE